MKWIIILTIFLCVPFSSLAAATIHVPDDYPTIQQAIDAAFEHDTVIVRPNTYVENINFKGKAITLMSEQGPEGTIIDGDQASSVVTFDSGEGANSILDGFTITNGFSLSGGGGIYCQNSSPTIKNNKITTNFAGYNQPNQSGFGGGMFNVDSNPIVTHCEFSENGAGRGGGMSNFGESSPTVMHCNFIGNNAWWLGGGGMANAKSSTMVSNCAFVENFSGGWWPVAYGGGISGGGIITNCIFKGNEAIGLEGDGGAGIDGGDIITNCTFTENYSSSCILSGGVITNTIIWDNSGLEIAGNPTVTYCDIKDGYPGTGNIDADPFFLDPLNGDFRLTYASPCIDAGDNDAPSLPDRDFEGDPRIFPGNGKGVLLAGSAPASAIVDMGADEYCLMKRETFTQK